MQNIKAHNVKKGINKHANQKTKLKNDSFIDVGRQTILWFHRIQLPNQDGLNLITTLNQWKQIAITIKRKETQSLKNL